MQQQPQQKRLGQKRVSLAVSGAGRSYVEENLTAVAESLGQPMTNDDLDALAAELGLQIDDNLSQNSDDAQSVSDSDSDTDNTAQQPQQPQQQQQHQPQQQPQPQRQQSQQLKPQQQSQPQVQAPKNFEGWLKKEGGKRKTLKKRWFVLNAAASTLFYHERPGDACLGCIPLMEVGVLSLGNTKGVFGLELYSLLSSRLKTSKVVKGTMMPGSHEAFTMYADSAEERDSWVAAINAATTTASKVVAQLEEKEAEKLARFKDIKRIITAYSDVDTHGHGVVPRQIFEQWMMSWSVSEPVAKAVAKVLDFDSTMLIELEAFALGWKRGILPLTPQDGFRCNQVIHDMIAPMIAIGAHKASKGTPFCVAKEFEAYMQKEYGLPGLVVNEISNRLQYDGKISSILYMRGVLRGVIPYSKTDAPQIPPPILHFISHLTAADKIESSTPALSHRTHTIHHISRADFTRTMGAGGGGMCSGMSRAHCGLVYDVATLRSGGKLTLLEFVDAQKFGIIPDPDDPKRDPDTISAKLVELQKAFNAFSGDQASFPISHLQKSLCANGMSKAQARVLCTAADSAANKLIDLPEFCRLVFWGLIDFVPAPVADISRTSSSSNLSANATPQQQQQQQTQNSGESSALLSPTAVRNTPSPTPAQDQPQQKTNHLEFSADVVAYIPKLLSGEISAIQLTLTQLAGVGTRVVQLQGVFADIAVEAIGEAANISINSFVVARMPRSHGFAFLTLLPPTSDHKEKMLYMLMRRGITNRLNAAGVTIVKEVESKNPQTDLRPNNISARLA